MRVVREQQYGDARGQHKHHANDGLLYLRPAPLRPGQQQGPGERGAERGHLHRGTLRCPAHGVGKDDTDAGNLRHGQIDENNAARKHLHAQRHMGGGNQQSGDEGR